MRTLLYLLAFCAGLACGRMARQRSIPAWQYQLARRYPPPATFTPQYVSPEQEQGYRKRQEEVRRASVQLDRMKQDLDRITRSP